MCVGHGFIRTVYGKHVVTSYQGRHVHACIGSAAPRKVQLPAGLKSYLLLLASLGRCAAALRRRSLPFNALPDAGQPRSLLLLLCFFFLAFLLAGGRRACCCGGAVVFACRAASFFSFAFSSSRF